MEQEIKIQVVDIENRFFLRRRDFLKVFKDILNIHTEGTFYREAKMFRSNKKSKVEIKIADKTDFYTIDKTIYKNSKKIVDFVENGNI